MKQGSMSEQVNNLVINQPKFTFKFNLRKARKHKVHHIIFFIVVILRSKCNVPIYLLTWYMKTPWLVLTCSEWLDHRWSSSKNRSGYTQTTLRVSGPHMAMFCQTGPMPKRVVSGGHSGRAWRRIIRPSVIPCTQSCPLGVTRPKSTVLRVDSPLKCPSRCCRSITRAYYRNSVGGLLLFDITNRRSFQNVHDWLEEARSHVQPHSIVFLLVGHKCDLEAQRQVCTVQTLRPC